MKKILAILLVVGIAGCAGTPKAIVTDTKLPVTPKTSDSDVVLRESVSEAPSELEPVPVEKKGAVFGKTVFKGVLETNYVRMVIERIGEKAKTYEFYIGSKANKSVLPWEGGKTVEPGYFFLQFPKGAYHITSLSIPVGTAMATEEVDLVFTVTDDAVTYLGTLEVNGTKERIKFGGVPVVKPGFEYVISVYDEHAEAEEVLKRIGDPGQPKVILSELMRDIDKKEVSLGP